MQYKQVYEYIYMNNVENKKTSKKVWGFSTLKDSVYIEGLFTVKIFSLNLDN